MRFYELKEQGLENVLENARNCWLVFHIQLGLQLICIILQIISEELDLNNGIT
jgi:hypothetical protein